MQPKKEFTLLDISNFCFALLKCGVIGVSALIVATPIVVYFCPLILTKIIFANWVPSFGYDPSKPHDYGLDQARNFYLHVEEGVVLGAWHIFPDAGNMAEKGMSRTPQEADFIDGYPVLLYLHGNDGNRGANVRVEVYKFFTKLNFHVISIDYRGYGESTGEPSEDGLVRDALTTYNMLTKVVGHSKLIVWGHSLGSAIAVKLCKQLSIEGRGPDGLVLEAPFNNLRDGIKEQFLMTPYTYMPWCDKVFVDPCTEQGIVMESDESIKSVTCEILILHDIKDSDIPYSLGQKLHKAALDSRSAVTKGVTMESFTGCGHYKIYTAQILPDVLRNFLSKLE